jgi:hypothetical protein
VRYEFRAPKGIREYEYDPAVHIRTHIIHICVSTFPFGLKLCYSITALPPIMVGYLTRADSALGLITTTKKAQASRSTQRITATPQYYLKLFKMTKFVFVTAVT